MTQRARPPGGRRAGPLLVVAALLSGCSPPLDWRESRPEGSGATLMFPCRPDRHERDVPLATTKVRMRLHSCKAAETTFSLAFADAVDPAQVATLLRAWRELTIGNVEGVAAVRPLPTIAGATPSPESQFLRIDGRFPDKRRVVVHAIFFVKGLRVYQATVVGPGDGSRGESLETFFDAIRLV